MTPSLRTDVQSCRCVLVPNNERGGLKAELCSSEQRYLDRQVNMGTPMFISVELSSTQPQSTSDVGFPVLPRLQAIDDPKYAELRARAFPGDSSAVFMAAFARIADGEVKSRPKRVYTDPRTPHRPRHDMESLHWVVLWAFIRAAPIPRRDIDHSAYSCFCTATKTLLDHSFGDEVNRSGFRIWPPVAGLDPLLKRYAPLIEDMAMYVSMPWHLYEPDPAVPRDHAHIALQRMLLSELVQLGGDTQDDVFFDPTNPRATRDFWDSVVRREVPISCPDDSGSPKFRTVLVGITGGDAPMRPLKRSLLDREIEAVERDLRPPKRRLRSTDWAFRKSRDGADEESAGEPVDNADDDSRISAGVPGCSELTASCGLASELTFP